MLAAPVTTSQHTRMPLFVLGMSIAEPSVAFRAMHGRRKFARLVDGDTAWHKRSRSLFSASIGEPLVAILRFLARLNPDEILVGTDGERIRFV
jgi:hypothetical protein